LLNQETEVIAVEETNPTLWQTAFSADFLAFPILSHCHTC